MEVFTQPKNEEKINQISMLMYPENLEGSKVISLLSENLSLKTADLLSLKEVSKYVQSKEELISIIKYLNFIKVSDDSDHLTYIINDNMLSYQILNIPQKLSKQEIAESLNLSSIDHRLYKRSIFWVLTVESIEKSEIEKILNSFSFEGIKLKYDLTDGVRIAKSMHKHIQSHSYQKEACQLKAGDQVNSNKKEKRDSICSNPSADAFSWRKKSGDSTQEEKAPSRPYTNYKGKQSNNFPKRERFNSDGNQPTNNHNKYTIPKSNEKEYNSSHEEIEIDMTNVKYPFTIKYKYPTIKMLDFFEMMIRNNLFDKRPAFNIEVENLFGENRKDCVSFKNIGRDRSNTYAYSGDIFKIKSDTHDRITNNSSVKIPSVNPLSKFDHETPIKKFSLEEEKK